MVYYISTAIKDIQSPNTLQLCMLLASPVVHFCDLLKYQDSWDQHLEFGLIFQQLFPCIPLCVPSQSLIDAQTVPNSKTFQRCSRSNINCIHSFQKVKFIAGCSYILYNVHSYVLVLDSVGQYIEVIFIFHNIT